MATNVLWPQTPLHIGQEWPKVAVDGAAANTPCVAGFDSIDTPRGTLAPKYTGNSFESVPDPAGTSTVVAKVTLRPGENADVFGGHRAEMWKYPRDVPDGDDSWRAWSVWFPDGFATDGWGCTIGQVHPGDGLSPVIGFYIINNRMIFAVRDVANHDLGPVATGRWVFILSRLVTRRNNTGLAQCWVGIGTPPDALSPPRVTRANITTMFGPGNSWDKFGLYSAPTTTRTQVVYLGGYGRSSSRLVAQKGARFSDLSAPASSSAGDLVLSVVAEDASTVTLGWVPPADALGYVFYANDQRVSRTWDAGRRAVTFAKNTGPYRVQAIRAGVYGLWRQT